MLGFLLASVFGLITAWQLPPPSTVPPPSTAPRMVLPANTTPDGITVRGFGTASAMADAAAITLHLFARNNALVIDQAALEPIVDALVRSGVARNDIATPIYLSGPAKSNNATIVAVVHHPTAAMLQAAIPTLSSAFTPDSPLILNNAEVRLTTTDCSAERQQAEAAAIKQARLNAQNVARDLGVKTGAIIAADVQTPFVDVTGGCTYTYLLTPYQNNQFRSAEDYLRIRISSSVTVRYAIR